MFLLIVIGQGPVIILSEEFNNNKKAFNFNILLLNAKQITLNLVKTMYLNMQIYILKI